MKKITLFFMVSVSVCLAMVSGCNQPPPPNPNRGFDIRVTANGIQSGADLQRGLFISGNSTAGVVSEFPRTTLLGVGFTQLPNARVPGTWRLTYGAGLSGGSLCLGIETVDRSVSLGSQLTLPCTPRFFSFTASPNAIDALSPPSTIDVSGNGSENLSGTPMIAFYNEFGNVVASGPASQLLYGKGGSVRGVRVNTSNLSQAFDGTYTGLVHNVNPDGTWEVIGAAEITIYGNPPPPDDGGGGECGPATPDSLRPDCNY